jgi:hypothetical protein
VAVALSRTERMEWFWTPANAGAFTAAALALGSYLAVELGVYLLRRWRGPW